MQLDPFGQRVIELLCLACEIDIGKRLIGLADESHRDTKAKVSGKDAEALFRRNPERVITPSENSVEPERRRTNPSRVRSRLIRFAKMGPRLV